MTSPFDTDACDGEAARLVPWFVNGRLTVEEAARVEEHLAACPVCRADVAEQRRLRALMRRDDPVEYAPQPSLQKLMTRIDELDREIAVDARLEAGEESAAMRSHVPRWMVAAVVLQSIGLGLLGVMLWEHSPSRTDAARYVTLSADEATDSRAPRVRVVFAPETTMSEVALMLGALRASIVDGPTEAGAYTLALHSGGGARSSVDAGLARLRADRHVLFAEPVAGSEGRQ